MVLYQTVEDRGNPEEINNNGPFECTRDDAWLGDGYYFWDTFIDNAQWWGNHAYHKRGYVISKYIYDFSNGRCFDLLGDMEHVAKLKSYVELLREAGLPVDSVTVPYIIALMKEHVRLDDEYEGIRVRGEKEGKSKPKTSIIFSATDPHYINLLPVVQVCLFRKDTVSLSKGEIVYPTAYMDGFVI